MTARRPEAVKRQSPDALPRGADQSVAPINQVSPLHAMPGHLIRRLQQVHAAIFAEECAAHGLTSVQFAALVAIGDNPGIDATRLSAVIAFDRSTIGDVLERLETRGWIARVQQKADRRIKLLHLNPAGRAVLDAVRPAVARVQQRVLEPLPPEDRARFIDLLARLTDLHAGVTESRALPG